MAFVSDLEKVGAFQGGSPPDSLTKLCEIMAGGNFVQRVMSFLVNEILVDSLANSRSFQRFAVKTSKSLDEMSSIVAKKKQEIADQVKEMSQNFESKNH